MKFAFAARVPLAVVAIAAAGCGLAREKSATAPAGSPQVSGRVLRAGVPVVGMTTYLAVHDSLEAPVDSAVTDGSGTYAFMTSPPGPWVVRVSPTDPGDLGYVRAFFTVVHPGDAIAIVPMDIDASGLTLVAPVDSAVAPLPSFGSPLRFVWTAYQGSYLSSSARLSVDGVIAWTSTRSRSTQADWNGTGNRGTYAGQTLGPGNYRWRVKLQLPNSVQAATQLRALILQ